MRMTTASLAALMTRTPRRYHAGRAEDAAALVADFPPELRALIENTASTSPYLLGLVQKEVDWLRDAIEDPDKAVAEVIASARENASDTLGVDLRIGKRRVALMAALADLGGAWSLEQVTGALTEYADAACQSALRSGIAQQIKRGKPVSYTHLTLPTKA